MMPHIPLILASGSPRRKTLLEAANIPFHIQPSTLHEPDYSLSKSPPARQAEALAYLKARSVADRIDQPALVLGADTLVHVRGRVLNKPANQEQAREFLQTLSNSVHEVITGVAIVRAPWRPGDRRIAHARTRVHFTRMTENDIADYLATGQWRDKAGAYAIQEQGADRFVSHIEGDMDNVVGLPVKLVQTMLRSLGWPCPPPVPA